MSFRQKVRSSNCSFDKMFVRQSVVRENVRSAKCLLAKCPATLSSLLIGEQIIETVQSHKVLGLTIQGNLKWNEHINSITAKASKRLYFIRILRRNGVPVEHLIEIYFALKRSVLEYCCPVWHNALPLYLAEQLERVQKRAFRIILPEYTYI